MELFPRGSGGPAPSKDDAKAPKKRGAAPADVLFGTKGSSDDAASKKSKTSATEEKVGEGFEYLVKQLVRQGDGKGKRTRLQKVAFATYAEGVLVLGVVRSVSEQHVLVSLPGALVGHVARSEDGRLGVEVGAVVRCCVLSTRRERGKNKSQSKAGAKRIELSFDVRRVQAGVRLDDLANNRVTGLVGVVRSVEARGYLVDVGVAGATAFLPLNKAPRPLLTGDLVECRVRKADAETGVVRVDATAEAVAEALAHYEPAAASQKWTFNALVPGMRVRCAVHRRIENGIVTKFLGDFAGAIEHEHAPGVGDEDGFVDARVLMVDRANKTVRLTTLPHLMSFAGVGENGLELPAPGTRVVGAVVEAVFDGVGLLLNKDGDRLYVHVSRLAKKKDKAVEEEDDEIEEEEDSKRKALKKKEKKAKALAAAHEEDWPEVGSTVAECRVVGSLMLEGWAVCSMTAETLKEQTPISLSDVVPGSRLEDVLVLTHGSYGASVRLSETLGGMITNTHFPKQAANFKRRLAAVRVLGVQGDKVSLTAKKMLLEDASPALSSYAQAAGAVGRSFTGFVTGMDAKRGLVVTFYGGVFGRVPPPSLRARGVEDVNAAYSLGDVLRVSVRKCVEAKGKMHVVLALEATSSVSDDAGPPLEVGAVYDGARIVELLQSKKKNGKKGAKKAAEPELAALVRLDDAGGVVVRLSALDASDHGAAVGAELLRAHAAKGGAFRVVVVRAAREGALATVSAQPLLVAHAAANAARGATAFCDSLETALSTGLVVVGTVNAVESYGAFVSLPHGLRGLVLRKTVAEDFEDVARALRPGDAVQCLVTSMDDQGRALLSPLRDSAADACAASFLRDYATVGLASKGAVTDLAAACKRLQLGHAADARVASRNADGAVELSLDLDATASNSPLFVSAAHALRCAVGDVVKVRALCVNYRTAQLDCSMLPALVRGGRAKKRKLATLSVGDALSVRAIKLLSPSRALALVVLEDTGALALLELNGYASRLTPTDRGLPKLLNGHEDQGYFDLADGDVMAVGAEVVVVSTAADSDDDSNPFLANASLPRLAFSTTIAAAAAEPPRKKSKGPRREALPPVAVDDLAAGDAVQCRVLAKTPESLQLSVRSSEDDEARRKVRAQLHLCDATADLEIIVPAKGVEGAMEKSHPFDKVHVGAILRCYFVAAASAPGARETMLSVAASPLGLRTVTAATWAAVPATQTFQATALAASNTGPAESLMVKVAASPILRGLVPMVDVVNRLYDEALDAKAAADPERAAVKAVKDAAKLTVVGAKLVVAKAPPGRGADKRAATAPTFLTPWLDDAAAERMPKVVSVGTVCVALEVSSSRPMQRRFLLPLGQMAVACLTECADQAAWTDLGATESRVGTYHRCIVLAAPDGSGGAFWHVSLRASRLATNNVVETRPVAGRIQAGFVTGADAKKGVFVQLSRGFSGRVLLKDLADGYVADVLKAFPTGKLVAPLVLSLGSKGVELSLRSKTIERLAQVESKWGSELKAGCKLSGVVTRVEVYGAFIKLDDAPLGFESGLCHKSELADEFVSDVSQRLHKGDKVKCVVLEVEAPVPPQHRHKLKLGLKPSYFKGDAEEEEEDDEEGEDDAEDAEVDEGDDEEGDDDDDDDAANEAALARVDAMLAGDSDDDVAVDDDDEDDAEENGDDAEEEDEDEDEDEDDAPKAAPRSNSRSLAWDDDDGDAAAAVAEDSSDDDDADEVDDYERETELAADGSDPKSTADFERVLIGRPNDGGLWMRYMDHVAATQDLARARAVAQQALERINYRDEASRLDVWAKLISLEKDGGTAESLAAAVDSACASVSPQGVLVRAAELCDAAGDAAAADLYFRRAEKRSKRADAVSQETWAAHWRSRLSAGDADGANNVLKRAIQAAPARDAVALRLRFASAEFDVGSAERAKTLFDALAREFPKRLDIWTVYVAKHLKRGDVAGARGVHEQCAAAPLPPKQMQAALKKFAEFEKEHGTKAQQLAVKDLAKRYVESRLQEQEEE
ncbi:hypothetical protein M885DRAFT_612395 [Pelagophyceae sp. CCMP2097]|nr:hypothetical protein M885DRAFT_612395 [Pelagophyceae sp. CCMP2097]